LHSASERDWQSGRLFKTSSVTFFTKFFTGNVLNFAYIAHSDEAFLASIVIFIWHLYNVHLTPAVFPMGKAWLNGFMNEREIMQYHYLEYVKAMQDAGLQDSIKGIYTTSDFKSGLFKTIFTKVYLFVMAVAGLTSFNLFSTGVVAPPADARSSSCGGLGVGFST